MDVILIILVIVSVLFIFFSLVLYRRLNKQKSIRKCLSFKDVEIHEIGDKYKLWVYWDDLGKRPGFIDMCLDSIKKNSYDFDLVVVNSTNIRKYIPELIQLEKLGIKLNDLSLAHRVDFYRIMLLLKYGGLYLDADILLLQSPIEVMTHLENYDFVGFGCTGDICFDGYSRPSNWALASRPNTQLMWNIFHSQLKYLCSDVEELKTEYHVLGKYIIWNELDALIENGYEYYHYPVELSGIRDSKGLWVTPDRLFTETPVDFTKDKDLVILVMYNSMMKEYRHLSKKEILSKKWIINKYYKRAIKDEYQKN